MRFSPLALSVSLLAVALSSCVCAPSKAGDACDATLDEDPCPSGLVCQATPDGGTCFVVLGGSCDKDADNAFCADGAACAGADPICGGLGGDCAVADDNCAGDLVCERRDAGDDDEDPGLCALPVLVTGRVLDAETRDPIDDADVVALDALGSAITRVATTNADGRYSVRIPTARNDDGKPRDGAITLRAAARDHQPFPGGLRTALPIALQDAQERDDAFVIESSLTDVALLALPAAARGRATVSGTIAAGAGRGGVLVVVEGAERPSPSALSDGDGVFRVFNVQAGSPTVRGYAAGLQLTPAEIDVGGDDVTGVVLARAQGAGATVSGSVQIVNAPGSLATSVVLVVESTFVDSAARGEVPRGLRAPDSGAPSVDGAFSISGVPEGAYVVLAAFENDGLVRDPDPNIAGTQLVRLDVSGDGEQDIGESFKITEALAVVSPGADGPELVDAPPTFVFGNDSSEDGYRVDVFDSFGDVVWTTDVTPPNGSGDVTVLYEGPALDAGAFYQFRATSLRDGAPISTTEDLRGVFVVAQ